MRKLGWLLLAAVFLSFFSPALAEGLTLGEDLTGVYCYPEGASEADALYVYRYSYPQLKEESELATLINTTYAYTASDALAFEAPMHATDLVPGSAQKLVTISYEITCNNAAWLSVRIVKEVRQGDSATQVISGHVFPLTGEKQGQIISLPYLLGILDGTESDTWLQNRQTAKANECVRELVWEELSARVSRGELTLLDGVTFDSFGEGFYPEEDFYLDEAGDPVFFLQAGVIAPEEAGVLLIPITLETLLDEI